MTHELKLWPEFFLPIKQGLKTFEIRNTQDRNFAVGDKLHLRVWDPIEHEYTGEQITVDVTYIAEYSSLEKKVVMLIVPTNDKKESFDKTNESVKLAEVNEPMKNQTNDGKTEAEVLLGEIHKAIVDRMGFWNSTTSGDSSSNRIIFMAMLEVANAINATLVSRKVESPPKPVETKAERIARLAVEQFKQQEICAKLGTQPGAVASKEREKQNIEYALAKAALVDANFALNKAIHSEG